jgi:hypothetical protein
MAMQPEEQSLEHKRLRQLTHRNLMQLIDSELKRAITMAELAETEAELGDEIHARGLLDKVEQAIDTVRHHMSDDGISEDEERDINNRLRKLGERLELAKHHVNAEPYQPENA